LAARPLDTVRPTLAGRVLAARVVRNRFVWGDGRQVANVLAEGEWVVEWQVGLDGVAIAAAVALWRDSWPLDGLPVTEEFVVLVVAAVAAPDFRVVGDELDALDPLHLFEAELDLVAEP
jgi:hypothetical protein